MGAPGRRQGRVVAGARRTSVVVGPAGPVRPDCPGAGRGGRVKMQCPRTVILEHRPGELARLGEVTGEAGVSIRGLAAFTGEGRGVVHVLLDDEAVARCRAAIERAGIGIADEREVPPGVDRAHAGRRGRRGEHGRPARPGPHNHTARLAPRRRSVESRRPGLSGADRARHRAGTAIDRGWLLVDQERVPPVRAGRLTKLVCRAVGAGG